ncbi:MAG: hypothetical protein ACK5Z2_13080 [Bacteroidota bacterium]|jgi:hypothetical protein
MKLRLLLLCIAASLMVKAQPTNTPLFQLGKSSFRFNMLRSFVNEAEAVYEFRAIPQFGLMVGAGYYYGGNFSGLRTLHWKTKGPEVSLGFSLNTSLRRKTAFSAQFYGAFSWRKVDNQSIKIYDGLFSSEAEFVILNATATTIRGGFRLGWIVLGKRGIENFFYFGGEFASAQVSPLQIVSTNPTNLQFTPSHPLPEITMWITGNQLLRPLIGWQLGIGW